MSDYKQETIRTYDAYADVFDQKFGRHFAERVHDHVDRFISVLSGPRVMDLGSGPGNHAVYFKDAGLDVFCVDLSKGMVDRCRSKGLQAEVGDIENLSFDDESFDGIWAYASLLHVPKEKLPDVVERLRCLLKPNGILGIAVKEGEGEGYVEEPEKYPGMKRWFTLFSEEDVRRVFHRGFRCLDASRQNVKNKYIFLQMIFQRVAE